LFIHNYIFRTTGMICLVLLFSFSTAIAGTRKHDSCDKMIHLSEEAEMQMGGAMYTGSLPKKGEENESMSGMKMTEKKEGMKMSGKMHDMKMDHKDHDGMKMDHKDHDGMKMDHKDHDGMKMDHKDHDGMKMAHMDHESKLGGVFFMAPNKMHHLEAIYSRECGFQLYLYNAFTRPINVNRFLAFLKVTGEVDGEEDELTFFLEPNKSQTSLQNDLEANLSSSFEIELHLKFSESEEVELFNFSVDKQGKIM
jgi:hypothetical protein